MTWKAATRLVSGRCPDNRSVRRARLTSTTFSPVTAALVRYAIRSE